ncbi:MAG: type II toxin-antitoxin system RelE/ParE family toxin [Candidatus Hydrogenedentes bacterium]|nr:type II toxin-antitoxin system RelE/ParE family toxin [Candidatus Hydrogenedentota bacterium]
MRKTIVLSEEAKEDIFSLWQYINEDNPAAASTLVAKIFEAFDLLSDFPLSGRACPEFTSDIRVRFVKKYAILHRLSEESLEIIRVLHTARDIRNIVD